MKLTRRIFAALVATAMGAVAPALAQSDEPIKLGAFVPVTGAGALGEASLVAVELAVKQINEAGGIAGRQVQMTVADYQTDPTIGVGEANRLVHQVGIDMAVGPTYSQVTLAVLPLLSAAQIPSINVSGSSTITPAAGPYSFSMLPNAETQARAMVDNAASQFGAKKVAIFSDNGAQAKTAVAEIQKVLEEKGIELTGIQEYNYNSKDLTPQLLALRSGEPDAILLFTSTGDDTANVLLSRAQLNWDVNISGSYGVSLATQALAAGGPELFKNVIALNYAGFTYCKADGKPQKAIDLVEAVRAYKPGSADRYPMNFLALFYDSVFILKAAVEGNGGDTSGPAVAKWIVENISSFDGVNKGLAASAESHFLVGPEALSVVKPDTIDEYGIQERAGC
ncbi:ABC transporter substrate-binding protein [Chelativorans sp. J32]|uniref:ABC transporter substrate-binding protein n=1 Tax=Chelativorans sp. J32 TaxID=935840 RepID=UPI0004AE4DC0|nr:ABC transporter substrate-binding protein [Chelativorans sp. J32]